MKIVAAVAAVAAVALLSGCTQPTEDLLRTFLKACEADEIHAELTVNKWGTTTRFSCPMNFKEI